jgi:hypothetical protein
MEYILVHQLFYRAINVVRLVLMRFIRKKFIFTILYNKTDINALL